MLSPNGLSFQVAVNHRFSQVGIEVYVKTKREPFVNSDGLPPRVLKNIPFSNEGLLGRYLDGLIWQEIP